MTERLFFEGEKMPWHQKAYLWIEKGSSPDTVRLVPLAKNRIVIGRYFSKNDPDVSFSNPVISRDHLLIKWKNGSYHARDDNSKNGTKINEIPLEKAKDYELHDGDRLRLADDAVILLFSYDADTTTLTVCESPEEWDVRFNNERKELLIDGKKIVLSGNLFRLFCSLYEHRGKVVSHAAIKEAVWPERPRDGKGETLATEEELHVLVMRLRKKLGSFSRAINNVRGFGYMLDVK